MTDPKRIVDGGTDELDAASASELRDLLGAARRDVPDADRMAAVFARLPVGPGGGGGGGASGGAGLVKASGFAKTPWIFAGLIGVGAIGAGVVVTQTPSGAAPTFSAPTPSATDPVPVVVEASATAVAAPSSSTAPAVAASSSRVPAPTSSAQPARPEIEILKEAQGASGANPARVLVLVAEHERSWPRGSLGQERDMLRIQALVALGRQSDAKQRAEAFRKAYPKSAYVQRLDAMSL